MKEIRLLNKNEISAKVKTVLYGGKALILLYKDARVDMTLLDETFGPMNWKRSHKEVKGNLFCTISIWDEDKKQWIDKEDVGIESQSEGEKGEASDSFKRSGFNWGIGRELYTAPVITIKLENDEYKDKKVYTRFYVSEIGYNGRDISLLEIVDGNGRKRFSWKSDLPMGNDEKDMELVDYEIRITASALPEDVKAKVIKALPIYTAKTLEELDSKLKLRGF
jgi:hypothetical protein